MNNFDEQNNVDYRSTYDYPTAASTTKKKRRMPKWLKVVLIIILIIFLGIFVLGTCVSAIESALGNGPEETYEFIGDYIGVLYLDGTISSGDSGDGYNHAWIRNRVEQMAKDDGNKGILLSINTPGGSAFATVELYRSLLEYKESTERPIYVYMGNQATSGGYYVAMAADKIFANEECWTGSIGVVISGLYDFSGLMERYGVSAENITSGRNKDMGTNIKPMTDEQREIFQGLVDDSFDHFIAAVVDGRGMSEAKVRELADGRIYTASQALENGLIDAIGTLDDTAEAMKEECDLDGIKTQPIRYNPKDDLLSRLGLAKITDREPSDLGIIKELLEESQEIEILCIADKKAD